MAFCDNNGRAYSLCECYGCIACARREDALLRMAAQYVPAIPELPLTGDWSDDSSDDDDEKRLGKQEVVLISVDDVPDGAYDEYFHSDDGGVDVQVYPALIPGEPLPFKEEELPTTPPLSLDTQYEMVTLPPYTGTAGKRKR